MPSQPGFRSNLVCWTPWCHGFRVGVSWVANAVFFEYENFNNVSTFEMILAEVQFENMIRNN